MYNIDNRIDDIAIKVIQDRKFRKETYHSFLDNCYELDLDDSCSFISSDVLRLMIKKAKWNQKTRLMLPAFLRYIDSSTLTDENFQMLLRFHGKYRNTCLSAIGHLKLPFYQMCILNRYSLGYEVFCSLFDTICKFDCFIEQDMLRILEENYDVRTFAIRECIQNAREKYGNSNKLEIAEKWLRELPKSSKHYQEHTMDGSVC